MGNKMKEKKKQVGSQSNSKNSLPGKNKVLKKSTEENSTRKKRKAEDDSKQSKITSWLSECGNRSVKYSLDTRSIKKKKLVHDKKKHKSLDVEIVKCSKKSSNKSTSSLTDNKNTKPNGMSSKSAGKRPSKSESESQKCSKKFSNKSSSSLTDNKNTKPNGKSSKSAGKRPSKSESPSKSQSNKLAGQESFERYGIKLPTFQQIIETHKKLETYEKSISDLEHITNKERFERTFSLDLSENNCNVETLDCKHLSKDDLISFFRKYKKKLKNIITGKEHSTRHDMFHQHIANPTLQGDISYASCFLAFSDEQKDILMDLLQKKFDSKNKKITYIFKVLLVELCFLIFMNEHNFTQQQAEEYLDKCLAIST